MFEKDLFSTFETIEIRNEKLILLPQKAIYWPTKKLLLIADLHLGKSTHFRKNGIAVPKETEIRNQEVLAELFEKIKPKRVNFLGDLFHSSHNKEWQSFMELISRFPNIKFELTLGNHDILENSNYLNAHLTVFKELTEVPFIFTHEPLEHKTSLYNLAGHIHPGVRLKGKGNQKHRVACFYFGENGGILPAFGSFTGLFTIKPKKNEKVFVVTGEEVICV